MNTFYFNPVLVVVKRCTYQDINYDCRCSSKIERSVIRSSVDTFLNLGFFANNFSASPSGSSPGRRMLLVELTPIVDLMHRQSGHVFTYIHLSYCSVFTFNSTVFSLLPLSHSFLAKIVMLSRFKISLLKNTKKLS